MIELSSLRRFSLSAALFVTFALGLAAQVHANSFEEFLKKEREQMKQFHENKQVSPAPKVAPAPQPPPNKPKPPREVAKPAPKPEPKPPVKPESKPTVEPKPEPKPPVVPKPQAKPPVKPEPVPEPKPTAKPTPKPEPEPTPEPVVDPKSERAPSPQSNPEPAPQPPTVNQPNRFALLIGVSDYASSSVPDVPQNAPCVEAIRKALIRNGYPSDNIAVMTDKDATVGKVRSFLGTRVPTIVGENDMLLVYFAGHGAAVKTTRSKSGDGTEKYLLFADSHAGDLYGTALTMSELGRMFRRIRSNRLIFILDGCFTSAMKPRGRSAAKLDDDYIDRLVRKGSIVLTASRANESALTSPAHGQGIFTYHLIEMLNGAGDLTRDGIITLDEGYRYIVDRVKESAERMEGSQRPTLKGELQGDFPVARAPR